jgi:alpha-1,6-mannosyltransferase
MTVAAPVERPAEQGRVPSAPAAASRAIPWPWVRLLGLLLVAVATELLYVAFWPISYYLTQGADYTYQYLVQYGAIWERLLPLLTRFEATWPEAPRSLEFMVDALVRVFGAAFVLYLLAFWLIRAGLPRGWDTVAVLAPALAFQTTLFLMPGLFTTDLFSYVMYGHIAGPYDLNPYIYPPAYFPQHQAFHWIHPIWHYAPSVYGPAWIDFSWVLGRWIAEWTDVDKVLAYKLAINLGHLAGIAFLALAVHRLRPGQVLPSVLLYAWNPLILFEYGANGHNDAVMVAVMLLALALFALSWPLVGLVALTVSFLIKMASVLLVPYYVIAWARRRGSLPGFLLVLLSAGVAILAVIAIFYYPWWVGIETIAPILTWSQGPMFLNYIPDFLTQRVVNEYLLGPSTPDPAGELEQARNSVRLATKLAFVAYCAWELLRVWKAVGPRSGLALAAAGARVMLAFLLIANTWVLPWYFTWPLALAIVAGWDSTTAKVLLGFSLTAPLVMYYNHFWFPYISYQAYWLYLAPLLLVPLARLSRLAARRFGASPRELEPVLSQPPVR